MAEPAMLGPGIRDSPTEPPRPDFEVESLTPIEWSHYDVRLVAANTSARHAVLWLQRDGAVSIRTIDYDTGEEVERWDTTPARMPFAGRFHPLTGDLQADLAHYTSMLGDAWGQDITPGLTIAPQGQHVLYGVPPTHGRDGDAWQVADPDGHDQFRFAPTIQAAYDLAFSHDGTKVAWSGCCHLTEPRGNPYHLYLATIDGPARRITDVPHPGRPLFWPDGDTVFAASRHGDRVCVHRLSFDDPAERAELLCRPSADHAPYLFVVDRPNEETGHHLLLANPRGELGDYELVVIDPTDGTALSTVDTTTTHLDPRQVDGHRILLSSRALTLVDLHTGTSASLDETDFGGFISYPQVVRPTGDAPFALALRDQRHRADVHELVRITLPNAL